MKIFKIKNIKSSFSEDFFLDKNLKMVHSTHQSQTNSATKRIVIQGIPGAFHEIATRHFFKNENLKIVSADTFEDLMEITADQELSDGALMAIENTISGSLLNNYQLLHQSNLQIVGEVFLRIQQNLMVLPGQKIEAVTEVYSHPVAIAQCRKFFKAFPHIKLVESEDTASSAKMVQDKKIMHAGAIASSLAAEIYGLEIIAEEIETYKKNHTRFLVLTNDKTYMAKEFDKVSLCFTLPHAVGSLRDVLAVLALNRANLTKIQSVPLLDSAFEYLFFVDFLLENQEEFGSIMNLIKKHTRHLRVLGAYKKGMQYED